MKIKTLIVDDTVVWRSITGGVLKEFDEIEVAGTAPNGDIALRKIDQLGVDLVFLDVNMPGKDGVQVLEMIKEKYPATHVVMMSGFDKADITVKALEKGAIDFIRKPDGASKEENIDKLKREISGLLRLVKSRLETDKILKKDRYASKPDSSGAVENKITGSIPSTFSVICIGVSTGGPEALQKLIPMFPASLSVPILIVQHMPPLFTESLARSLDKRSEIKVVEGSNGCKIEPGRVYIAPGGQHMTVRKGVSNENYISLNDGPPVNSCRPSVDVLFRSISSVYENRGIISVILTGMGSDGLAGVRTIKRKGALSITQTEDSCVVYGMPRAVDENGLSDISLPIERIAPEICKHV